MARLNAIWLIMLILVLPACYSGAKRVLEVPERNLDTDGTITMHYHSALYYPDEIALKADGYIVGVEKSGADLIAINSDFTFQEVADSGVKIKTAREKVIDNKVMYVSHIIRDEGSEQGLHNCALYNAYIQPDMTVKQPIEPCLEVEKSIKSIPPDEAYRSSWQALETLQTDLRRRLKENSRLAEESRLAELAEKSRLEDGSQLKKDSRLKIDSYTHIVVIVMGWNTVQEEAIRNFNSIVRGIKKASEQKNERFNPLVIGLTWPSQWNSPWLDPFLKVASFGTKSEDADEVGVTWLGVLLHDTIPKANVGLPVVVIGHSFGSRAASTAACVGPIISNNGENIHRSFIDVVINYQGAFLVSRLMRDKSDGSMSLGDQCKNVIKFILTSSDQDDAMDTAFWGNYAGNDSSFTKYCKIPSPSISCAIAGAEGDLESLWGTVGRITYINADKLILNNAFYTGGGAHSDIYRDEQGKLSWQLINH